MIKDDRWYITEAGVRHLAKLSGKDPDSEVRRWKKELARRNRPRQRTDQTRLSIFSGDTMLEPKDVEAIAYTTEGAA